MSSQQAATSAVPAGNESFPQPSQNGDIVLLLPIVEALSKFVVEGPANVESTSRSIDYDMTTLSGTQFSDSSGFPDSEYNRETATLSALSQLAEAGQTFVSILYPYRSTSRALSLPVKEAEETDDQFKQRMTQYHHIAFGILFPEVDKIRKMMEFVFTCVEQVRTHFAHIVSIEQSKNVPSHPFLDLFILVLNNLILLNALKDNKASLANDFSSYKRTFNSVRASLDEEQAGMITEQVHQLQLFLGSPQHPRDYILYILRNAIQSVDGFESGICALFEHVKESLESSRWLLPENELIYLRIIPFLYYLLDTDMQDYQNNARLPKDPSDRTPSWPTPKKDVNAFRAKNIEHNWFKNMLKNRPVLPLYGDMHISVVLLLRNCAHWDEDSMQGDWVSKLEEKKIGPLYLLTSHHENVRIEYNKFMSDFAALLSETRAYRESDKAITPKILQRVLHQVLTGLKMVSRWSGLVLYQCAWKYAHPITDEQYNEIRTKNKEVTSTVVVGKPDEYEKAVRYNYTERELHVLIDILGMIKGVGSVMLENELTVTPLLNRAVHDNCQLFLQTEVARPLRKAYKNDRKDVLQLLLQIREIGGDWFDFHKQKDDYLLVKKDLLQVNRDFPRRPTAPSATQLALIRRMVHMVFSPRAAGMKSGFMVKKNLKDEWLGTWHSFYTESYYYQYLLDYGSTIKQVTDLSFLWFHEFYLQITGCVQFPISMSVPWVLTDYLINHRNMKDNVFFLFDIYNDAASKSLHVLKQKFLYDEIEAELNLAFEQLLFHLSTDIFMYYKSVAGSMLIDKGYKAKFQQAKATDSLTVRLVRYSSLLAQTRVSLLGRTLDVTQLVGEHCNRLLRENIQVAIRRYESSDFTFIVELSRLFQNIAMTHKLLVRFVPIDPLEQLFRECDDRVGLCSFRSRIMQHTFTELVTDIFPRYIYNETTQRFVRSPQFLHDETNPNAVREHRPAPQPFMWFGKGFRDAYERENSLFRTFVGIEHLSALLEVMHVGQEHMLARELTEELVTKFLTETTVYLHSVHIALPSTKPPGLQFSALAAYVFYEAKLKPIASWPQLRDGLFSKVRELGNGLAFLMLFEDAIFIKSHFRFQTEIHFSGIRPVPPRDPSLTSHEVHQQLFLRDHNSPDELPYVKSVSDNMTSLWNLSASNEFSKMTPFNEDNSQPVPVEQITTKDWFQPPFAHNKIHADTGAVVQNVITNAYASGYNLLLRNTHNPPSITSAAVARLIQACEDSGLTAQLSAFGQINAYQQQIAEDTGSDISHPIVELENGKRVIAALFFIFNQQLASYDGPKWGFGTKATSPMVGDRALFGDGFVLGLALILHAFGERFRFELFDFSSVVLRIDSVSPCPRAVPKPKDKHTQLTPQQTFEQSFLPDVLQFLHNAAITRPLLINYLDILESYCPAPNPDLQQISLSALNASLHTIQEGSLTRNSSLLSSASNFTGGNFSARPSAAVTAVAAPAAMSVSVPPPAAVVPPPASSPPQAVVPPPASPPPPGAASSFIVAPPAGSPPPPAAPSAYVVPPPATPPPPAAPALGVVPPPVGPPPGNPPASYDYPEEYGNMQNEDFIVEDEIHSGHHFSSGPSFHFGTHHDMVLDDSLPEEAPHDTGYNDYYANQPPPPPAANNNFPPPPPPGSGPVVYNADNGAFSHIPPPPR